MKRSDIPKFSKDMLNKILEMIFSDDEKVKKLTSIEAYVDEISKKVAVLAKSGDPIVTKSVNFSKPLEDYKNLPQHIKGLSDTHENPF